MSEHLVNSHSAFAQVSENMKNVLDVTSRIDERVKIIVEKQIESDKRFLVLMDHFNNLSTRVSLLEARDEEKIKEVVEANAKRINELEKQIEILQIHRAKNRETWRGFASAAVQVLTALATAYLLWKAGISPP